MTRVVIDASVAIKWHVTEVHSEAAQRFLAEDAPELHVPDLAYPELGNILWKKVRRGELTEGQGRETARLLAAAPWSVHPSAPYFEAALGIALRTGRTVYDCLYLALAVGLDCPMVTADEKLFNALKDDRLSAYILWVEKCDAVFFDEQVENLVLTPPPTAPAPLPSDEEFKLIYSYFRGDNITDADLIHLRGLPWLEDLYLTGPGVTDEGLVFLGSLDSIKTLYLNGSAISDAGLLHLAGLRTLTTLNLANTRITDAGLAHLRGLTGLKTLALWGTEITDAGLIHLQALSDLRVLDLEGTRTTEQGVQALKQVFPALKIAR